jgi:hypothetical protein
MSFLLLCFLFVSCHPKNKNEDEKRKLRSQLDNFIGSNIEDAFLLFGSSETLGITKEEKVPVRYQIFNFKTPLQILYLKMLKKLIIVWLWKKV